MTINDIIKETKTGYNAHITAIEFDSTNEELKEIDKQIIEHHRFIVYLITDISQKDLIKKRDCISNQYNDLINATKIIMNQFLDLRELYLKVQEERDILLDAYMDKMDCDKSRFEVINNDKMGNDSENRTE